MSEQILDQALRLAAAGFRVLPIKSRSKLPALDNWQNGSTRDPEMIRGWSYLFGASGAGVGINFWEQAGAFLLDVDVKDGQPGLESAAALGLTAPDWGGAGYVERSPSGGLHLVWAMPDWIDMDYMRQRVPELAGLECRRGPLQTVVAPSPGYVVEKGDLVDVHSFAEPPDAVVEAFLQTKAETPTWEPPRPTQKRGDWERIAEADRAYAENGMVEELRDLARCPKGNRNNALNVASVKLFSMVAAGWLDSAQVEASLEAAAESNGSVRDDGWSQVRKTIASGKRKGLSEPRKRPESDIEAAERQAAGAGVVLDLVAPPQTAKEVIQSAVAVAEATPVQPPPPGNPTHPMRDIADAWDDEIPPREWLGFGHYIRGFVGVTASEGGLGKSSLVIAEGMSMATGWDILQAGPKKLFSYEGKHELRGLYWNGEDPESEILRRVLAIRLKHELPRMERRFFVASGRDWNLKIAHKTKSGVLIDATKVQELSQLIQNWRLDFLQIDPFVTTHDVNENDNGEVNQVVNVWREIAHKHNIAVELVHHAGKAKEGGGASQDILRGASSLAAGARSVRALVPMSKDEAEQLGVERPQNFFQLAGVKANLGPVQARQWFQKQDHQLGNSSPDYPDGDQVSVIMPFRPKFTAAAKTASGNPIGADYDPQTLQPDQMDAIHAVHMMLESGDSLRWRLEDSDGGNWVGNVIANALDINVETDVKDKQVTQEGLDNRAEIQRVINLAEAGGYIESIGAMHRKKAVLFTKKGPTDLPGEEER